MADNKFAAYICAGCGIGDKLDLGQLEKIAQKEGKMQLVSYEVAITDNARVAKLINEYAAKIAEIGMSPMKGFG